MSRRNPPKLPKQPTEPFVEPRVNEFWQGQLSALGRNLMFVDTGAILEAHAPGGERYADFFETTTDNFVTSQFVISETVGRFVKSRETQYYGPTGERRRSLATYFIRAWLNAHRVKIIHIPEFVFDVATATFQSNHIDCDLTDILSFVIVNGLEQTRIAAKDDHFRQLGLQIYPGLS